MLQTPYCPRDLVGTEFYIPGTEPTRECNKHLATVSRDIDRHSGSRSGYRQTRLANSCQPPPRPPQLAVHRRRAYTASLRRAGHDTPRSARHDSTPDQRTPSTIASTSRRRRAMKRYHARWVVPVTQPPIENGSVVENDGVIAYVGPLEAAPPGEDHDLGESVLLPGSINTHTHLELTAMRGFLEDLCFNDWIDKLRSSRKEALTDEMLLDSARYGIVEGLHAGITTYADTCCDGLRDGSRCSRWACAESCSRKRSARRLSSAMRRWRARRARRRASDRAN